MIWWSWACFLFQLKFTYVHWAPGAVRGAGEGTQAWVRQCWPQGGRRGERQTQIPISTVGLGWKAAQKREESLVLKDEGPWAARTRLANRSWFPPGEFTGLIVRLFCETPVEPHTTCSLILVLSVERWNKLNFSPPRQPHQIAINRCTAQLPLPIQRHLPPQRDPLLGPSCPNTPSPGQDPQADPGLGLAARQVTTGVLRLPGWLSWFTPPPCPPPSPRSRKAFRSVYSRRAKGWSELNLRGSDGKRSD